MDIFVFQVLLHSGKLVKILYLFLSVNHSFSLLATRPQPGLFNMKNLKARPGPAQAQYLLAQPVYRQKILVDD